MSNSTKQASPIYFTYTYATNSRLTFEEDSQSIVSNQFSHLSRSSGFQSLRSTQRINELRPKSKIIISKCSTLANTKRKSESEVESEQSKISIDFTPGLRRNETIITESMEYHQIRPLISWNKFTFLCGFENLKMGEFGCLCNKQQCPWKSQWVKGRHAKDYHVFRKLINLPASQQNLIQIEKDLARTHPECPTFSKNAHFRQMLKSVLLAYSVYDIEMGYIQGVNMIAGVLLYHIKNAEQTFWALVEMMQYQELRMVYLDNFVHLKAHIQNINHVIMSKVNDLYNHMIELDVISDCFLNGWLLSLMSNAIPMEFMHEVVDRFRKSGWKYIYKLIVTYLLFLKEYLLISTDQAEFLINLNTQNSRELGIEWREMIQTAEKVIL